MFARASKHGRFALTMAAAVVGAACGLGCGPGGNGGSGDIPREPKANPYGTGLRISEIVGPATWEDPSNETSEKCANIPPDQEIFVTGILVTAHDTYDETGTGASGNYYVQDVTDPPAEFSGVTLFAPGFSPPALRVVNGDVLDLFGVFIEFVGPTVGNFNYCRTLPEMSGSAEFRFEGGGVKPAKILASDLNSYESARKWMGMLVEVENVKLAEDPFKQGSGRYSIRFESGQDDPTQQIPTITNELMDLETAYPDFARDQVLARVRGIVTYFYGVHLAPRSAEDVTP